MAHKQAHFHTKEKAITPADGFLNLNNVMLLSLNKQITDL